MRMDRRLHDTFKWRSFLLGIVDDLKDPPSRALRLRGSITLSLVWLKEGDMYRNRTQGRQFSAECYKCVSLKGALEKMRSCGLCGRIQGKNMLARKIRVKISVQAFKRVLKKVHLSGKNSLLRRLVNNVQAFTSGRMQKENTLLERMRENRVTRVTRVTRRQKKPVITCRNGIAKSRPGAPNASPPRHHRVTNLSLTRQVRLWTKRASEK